VQTYFACPEEAILEQARKSFPKRVALLLIAAGKWRRSFSDGLSKTGWDFLWSVLVDRTHSRAGFARARNRVAGS
jgi:hypothetical protein